MLLSRQPASGARETPVSPPCSPPGQGRQSSVRGRTRISFPNRAGGTTTPRSRLDGSTLPCALHFHLLPCLVQTSRFATKGEKYDTPAARLGPAYSNRAMTRAVCADH